MKREEGGRFMDHYRGWRPKRISKIESIFGKEFFKDKTILELGCGYGDIGKHFVEKLGSTVTFAEGRQEHIPFIKENNPNSKVVLLDQEKLWSFDEKFDVIIHFGVMYHLKNWKQDLECALKHTDLIILESEIADTDKIFEFHMIDPEGYDQAMNKDRKAVRPSAAYVEKVFEDNNFSYVRYDDTDLNEGLHHYNWTVTNAIEREGYSRNDGGGLRRFWVAKRIGD